MSPDNHHQNEANEQNSIIIRRIVLYRAMKSGTNNKPLIGDSARYLGVKKGRDIKVTEKRVQPNTGGISVEIREIVQPNKEGMSVTPDIPSNLPCHRRPPELGGTGKDPVWQIDAEILNDCELQYRPDPDKATHGFIEPIREMLFSEYQTALGMTQTMWTLLELNNNENEN